MKNNRGFIELKSISDYWEKLLFDYQVLKKNPENSYYGFNFFVTAYHLLDWIFEGKYSDERTELNKTPALKICNHIANGVKHFEPNRHGSVKEINKLRVYEEGVFEEGVFESPIMIQLGDEFRPKLGEFISITDFADYVINFWENELNNRKLI
ncbi:MAG: hypothetical protein ACYC0A_12220 [Lutibacter sp.]